MTATETQDLFNALKVEGLITHSFNDFVDKWNAAADVLPPGHPAKTTARHPD